MEVYINKQWKRVKPSYSNVPYEYDSFMKAWKMLNICYPMSCYNQDVRITDSNQKPIQIERD